MRSGFGRVHRDKDCWMCVGYNKALVTLRHPFTMQLQPCLTSMFINVEGGKHLVHLTTDNRESSLKWGWYSRGVGSNLDRDTAILTALS
jgi:hypothetical protein